MRPSSPTRLIISSTFRSSLKAYIKKTGCQKRAVPFAHLRLKRRRWIGVSSGAGRHDGHVGAVVAQVQEALGADLVFSEALCPGMMPFLAKSSVAAPSTCRCLPPIAVMNANLAVRLALILLAAVQSF